MTRDLNPTRGGGFRASDVGAGVLLQAQVVALAEELVAAARHFRAGRSERAMVALLPMSLDESELPGRVLRMVVAGVLVISAVTGELVDFGAFRSRITGGDPEVLVAVMVHLLDVFAELDGSL
jgi:hypothetical protein